MGDCPSSGREPRDQALWQVEHWWCPDQRHLPAGKWHEGVLAICYKARLESRLDTDLLSWCARVLAEENVSAYSLAVVCCGPVNHRLRHMISTHLCLQTLFWLNLCRPWLLKPISPQDYIAVKEKYAKYLPHSGGRYAAKRFRKAQCPIVERLTNSMMMHGRNNGKKLMTVRIVKHAFEIIHLLTGEVCTTLTSTTVLWLNHNKWTISYMFYYASMG